MSAPVAWDDPAIRFVDVWFRYEDHRVASGIPALNGLSLEIARGAFVAVVGQNGSGKTTLAKLVNGLLRPDRGHVYVLGQDTNERTIAQLAARAGYAFQNPDHQIFAETTRAEISFGPRNLGLGDDEVVQRTEETLELFGIGSVADAPPAVLGYGLRRKIAVASIVAMRPDILILDEPTAGLDARSTAELVEVVEALHGDGHTIVVITHDMRLVAEHCVETVVLNEGRVLASGPTRDVLCSREVLDAAQLAAPPILRVSQGLRPLGLRGDSLTVSEFVQDVASLSEAWAT